jgi:monoterpene epsilon-lactone hydrolase
MTTSQPTDPLGMIYAEWDQEFRKHPDMSVQLMRWVFEDWQRVTKEPSNVRYEEAAEGGVPGIWVLPDEADNTRPFLALHGGGFALGSSNSHRKMAGHLAKQAGRNAFVADFRLAPEYPFPAQIEDALEVIGAMNSRGITTENITPVGDSAGASIAIGTVLSLLQEGKNVPRQVVAISPWLDMENSGETIETNDATDFLITREGLQGNIDRYLSGGANPRDGLVNPLYADFVGFPRLYICVSDTESLYADSTRLAERAEAAGVDVTLAVEHGQQHVFPIQAGNLPAADKAIANIAAWCR